MYAVSTSYSENSVTYDDNFLVIFKMKEYFFGDNPLNIENCAVNAIHNMIGGNKFDLSLQLLTNDIKNGNFDKGLIIKDNQVYTSLDSLNKVLSSNKRQVNSFYMDVSVFTKNLKKGDSAILFVNGNHFIYVAKNSKGEFQVSDNNINNGKLKNYSPSEFNKLLKGEKVNKPNPYLNMAHATIMVQFS